MKVAAPPTLVRALNRAVTPNLVDPSRRHWIYAWLRLTRMENAAFGAMLYLVGMQISPGLNVEMRRLLLGGFIVASTVVVGNVVNDICDREIDAVGKPWRPIPSAQVSLVAARRALALTSLSVVVAAISINDPLLTLVALGMLAEAISYSLWLKTIPFLGNISVAFQVACAFAYGVFMAGGQVHQEIPILSGIFLGYLNFELAKTASDRWHDQLFIKTAATTLRPKGMWMLLVGLSLAHLSLMFAFALANADPSRSVALLGLPTVPLLGYLLYARKSHDTDSIERSIQISKKTFVPVLLILLLQGWLV